MSERENEVEELVKSVKNGCYDRFDELIKSCVFIPKTALSFLPKLGYENDDLYQEAVIVLLRALHSYDPEKGAGFRTYSSLCIKNHFSSMIRSGNRLKNAAMLDYVPLDDTVMADYENPEELWIEKEADSDRIKSIIPKLSAFEKNVLSLYLKGISAKDISEKLGKTEKAVYNALQRVRQKLRPQN